MGNRHPLSLKLKSQIKWSSIIYKYNINKEINKEKIINKIILQKYKNSLISKPVYEYRSNKLDVLIMEYKRKEENREEKLEIEEIREEKLEKKIEEKINKEINIKEINIKNPILDSKIIGRYIIKRIRKNSINKIRKKIKKMIKISKKEEKGEYTYNWLEIKEGYINKRIESEIKGIYIEIKGRINKGRRAKRSRIYRIRIGRLEFNKIRNIMDYTKIKENGENGVYTLKIGIKTEIRRGGI